MISAIANVPEMIHLETQKCFMPGRLISLFCLNIARSEVSYLKFSSSDMTFNLQKTQLLAPLRFVQVADYVSKSTQTRCQPCWLGEIRARRLSRRFKCSVLDHSGMAKLFRDATCSEFVVMAVIEWHLLSLIYMLARAISQKAPCKIVPKIPVIIPA